MQIVCRYTLCVCCGLPLGGLFFCPFLPPLYLSAAAKAALSSPTFQQVVRGESFQGFGMRPARIPAKLKLQVGVKGLNPGCRTLAELGKAMKFLRASGIALGLRVFIFTSGLLRSDTNYSCPNRALRGKESCLVYTGGFRSVSFTGKKLIKFYSAISNLFSAINACLNIIFTCLRAHFAC